MLSSYIAYHVKHKLLMLRAIISTRGMLPVFKLQADFINMLSWFWLQLLRMQSQQHFALFGALCA
jgi:hypothetical protein